MRRLARSGAARCGLRGAAADKHHRNAETMPCSATASTSMSPASDGAGELLLHRFQSPDLVPIARGFLKVQLCRSLLDSHQFDHLAAAAFEETHRMLHVTRVVLSAYQVDAGAESDLVLETWAAAMGKKIVFAGSADEQLSDRSSVSRTAPAEDRDQF